MTFFICSSEWYSTLAEIFTYFITPVLKALVVPVIWLALIGAIYSRIAPFFALNRIFFLANEVATLKKKTTNQTSRLV